MLIILDKKEEEPVGLTAKFIIDLQLNLAKKENNQESVRLNRIFEIQETINRFITFSKSIDLEWVKELNEHIEFFNDKYGQKE